MKIQIIVEEQGEIITKDIISLEKQELSAETLGLTLKEAKEVTSKIQETLVTLQVSQYIDSQNRCLDCNKQLVLKGHNNLHYRTFFNHLKIKSPRFYECDCHSHKHSSFSPLAQLLPERTVPELNYLESKWASLMSYGVTTNLLEEVFPLKTHPSSIQYNAYQTSTRLEEELGDEQYMFMEGSEFERSKLPNPKPPLIVGIDEGQDRKASWFEVIVGKVMQAANENKRFGFVLGL